MRDAVTAASNGTDYLAAWSDGARECNITCPPFPPFRLLAIRLREDGTPIDGAPLVIEQQNGYPDQPSIAWNNKQYLVAWSNLSEIRGARVSPEGNLFQTATLQRGEQYASLLPKVLPFGDGFTLWIRTAEYNGSIFRPVQWEAVAFAANENLNEIAGVPRFPLVRFEDDHYDSFAVDSDGSSLVAAYNVAGDRTLGGVARVVTRNFAQPPERRRVIRR